MGVDESGEAGHWQSTISVESY